MGNKITDATPPFGPPQPEVTTVISSPGETVAITQDFDTTKVADKTYRISAEVKNLYSRTTVVTETLTVDNRAPQVKITQPNPGPPPLVTDVYDVIGSVSDDHLAYWSLEARIAGRVIAELGSGTTEISNARLGTYSARMAPAGYVGPVELVLTASDSAIPKPNVSSVTRTIISDYFLDAYGVLDLEGSYEVSTTIPVRASITGQVATWHFEARRAGESEPLIVAAGNSTGEAVHLADFDVKNTYGPGDYVFTLRVVDSSGDLDTDIRAVTFIWRPARVEITFVSPPNSPIEVYGSVTGSNIWAWALGRPIPVIEPAFANDRVVFSSNIDEVANFDIYSMFLDGTGLARLTTHPGFDHAPKLSKDGSRVVFASTRQGSGTDVFVMNSDGTNIDQVTTFGDAEYPDFSPEATHIAYHRRDGIFELELSSGDEVRITTGEDRFANYSPDGSRLAFDRGARGSQQVFVADLTSAGFPTTQLTTEPDFSGQPAYSNSGEAIAFVHDNEIWVMGADGTAPASLGVGGADPAWLPDDSKIAYSSEVGPSQVGIYLIGSDPASPGAPVPLVVNSGSSRVPDTSLAQVPFPPAPASNAGEYIAVDVASFVDGSYMKPAPGQFPTGESGSPEAPVLLGHIETDRLPAGLTAIGLVALQCDVTPPEFVYRLSDPLDADSLATIDAIGTICSAHSTPQIPVRVGPRTAAVELSISVRDSGPGFAGKLVDGKSYSAYGSYLRPDGYSLVPRGEFDFDTPTLARFDGRAWAKGPPASSDDTYVPVGDLASLEDIHVLIDHPELGLQQIAGLESPPTPVATEETFAPGRTGDRYEVGIPASPPHLGGTTHLTAWADSKTHLLGALSWEYLQPVPGNFADLPGESGWSEPRPGVRTVRVRIDFYNYNRDVFPPVPDVGGGA